MVVAGTLALAANTASAQSGSPFTPTGYGAGTTYYAPTPPGAPSTLPDRTTSVRGLWIPGLVGLPVAWVSTWVHASLSLPAGSDAVTSSFVPLAGPWLVLASAQSANVPYFVVTGIVQDVSLICLVLGLVIRVPEPRARLALGEGATLDVSTTGSAVTATVQF